MSLSNIYASKMKCQEYERFCKSKGDKRLIVWVDEEYTTRTVKAINQRRWRLKNRAEGLGYTGKIQIALKDNFSATTTISDPGSDNDSNFDIPDIDDDLIVIETLPIVAPKMPLLDLFDSVMFNTPPLKSFADVSTQTDSCDFDLVVSFKDLNDITQLCGRRLQLSFK